MPWMFDQNNLEIIIMPHLQIEDIASLEDKLLNEFNGG